MKHLNMICNVDDILPNTGRAAYVNEQEIAIFRVTSADSDSFYAIDNFCPFCKANVLSRGIVGSINERLMVASPVYKQHFDLLSGQCLEDESVFVNTWNVVIEGSAILIELPEQKAA